MKPRMILVSACLMGELTRYDGTHKQITFPILWSEFFTMISVCPEVACGLPVPREPMRLIQKETLHIETVTSQKDQTEKFNQWLSSFHQKYEQINIHGAILKERSPSCGLHTPVYDSTTNEKSKEEKGLFAQLLFDQFPRIILRTEEELAEKKQMQKFIDQINQLA